MASHDVRHTGRSPYNTTQNPDSVMKWKVKMPIDIQGGSIVDQAGNIYVGSMGSYFYAFYPNGTIKWHQQLSGSTDSIPALDENAILYVGTEQGPDSNNLYAIRTSDGSIKWRHPAHDSISSSPAIGQDGTIYYGDWSGWFTAITSNGAKKWEYKTGSYITGSPVIGSDGTVYIGSQDDYLYAFYPDNGTMKWRFPTGGWIRVSPCISDDGTIYCVSFDNYLYAVNPDGTMKWKTFVNAGTNPTTGSDGTIYAGWDKLYALNPWDGSVKWTYQVDAYIEGGTPCTSREGVIYFGTTYHGKVVAINPDGTRRWEVPVDDCQSAPAIDDNGIIYIGAWCSFYAFGAGPLYAEANGPYSGTIDLAVSFGGNAFGGTPPYTYHWDFDDGNTSNEQNPTHTYTQGGTYNATLTITDDHGNTSTDNATVTIKWNPPSITLIRPVKGIYLFNAKIFPFFGPYIIGPITVKVNVTPNPLPISYVRYDIDNSYIAYIYNPPYSWRCTRSLPPGQHRIIATVFDTAGSQKSTWVDVMKIL